MKVTIEFDADNAVFAEMPYQAVSEALGSAVYGIAEAVETATQKDGLLRDSNGNTVGTWQVTP